jgi:hypothetical protein
MRKVQENQEGMELNGIHRLMAYTNDINIMSENINIIHININSLSEVSREVSLEVNTEKTKYMVMTHRHNIGQNHDLLIAKKKSL